MLAAYIFILALSTGIASWAALRLWVRIAPMFGHRLTQTGLTAILPAIAFLIVVAAPPSLLVAALLVISVMLLAPLHMRDWLARLILFIPAIALPLFFAHAPDAALTGKISLPAIYFIAALFWLVLLTAATHMDYPLGSFGLAAILACVPLAATPLLLHQESGVATDAAMLSAGWLGALLMLAPGMRCGLAAQAATALILGFLQLTAIWQMGWMTGLASIIIFAAGLLVARLRANTPMFEELAGA